MYFHSVEGLLAMDGHGAFVWSAYLIAVAVIAAILLAPRLRRRRFLRRLAAELKRQQGGPSSMKEGL